MAARFKAAWARPSSRTRRCLRIILQRPSGDRIRAAEVLTKEVFVGAYNDVRGTVECPNCHNQVLVWIQFKFADTAQHRYTLGDTLRWGGNDVGAPGLRQVLVQGEGVDCPICGFDGDWPVVLKVEADTLRSAATELSGSMFVGNQDGFIVKIA